MPATEELRVHIRTVADTVGARQTQQALNGVQLEAAQTGRAIANASAGAGSGFRESARSILQFAGALGIATTASQMAADAIRATVGIFTSSIQTQRENERLVRATAAAYGVQAQQFERFATALSTQTGFSSQAILQAALSARTLSANYGLSIQQTQKLIAVSADLARVRGIGVAESFERVQSAIRGEAEASEYLGLTLNDTFIKNNVMNGSLKDTFETMKDGEKAQIRYTELLRQAAPFAGQAAAAANSLDAAFGKLEVSTNKAQLALGKVAQPATVGGLQLMADAMGLLATNADVVLRTLTGLSPILGGLGKLGADLQRLDIGGAQAAAAASARAAREQTRLRTLNENLPPVAGGERIQGRASVTERAAGVRREERRLGDLAELAALDQIDAATRDLFAAQQAQVDLQRQAVQLTAQEAGLRLQMLPAQQRMAELQRDMAEQQARARLASLPASEALDDLRYLQERNRLISANRNLPVEQRVAARRESRTLGRAEPGVALAALEAQRSLVPSQRAAERLGLQEQLTTIAEQRILAPIQAAQQQTQLLGQIAAALTAQREQTLNVIIQHAIDVSVGGTGVAQVSDEQAAIIGNNAAATIAAAIHAARLEAERAAGQRLALGGRG